MSFGANLAAVAHCMRLRRSEDGKRERPNGDRSTVAELERPQSLAHSPALLLSSIRPGRKKSALAKIRGGEAGRTRHEVGNSDVTLEFWLTVLDESSMRLIFI